jgi:hypothetical protein
MVRYVYVETCPTARKPTLRRGHCHCLHHYLWWSWCRMCVSVPAKHQLGKKIWHKTPLDTVLVAGEPGEDERPNAFFEMGRKRSRGVLDRSRSGCGRPQGRPAREREREREKPNWVCQQHAMRGCVPDKSNPVERSSRCVYRPWRRKLRGRTIEAANVWCLKAKKLKTMTSAKVVNGHIRRHCHPVHL